MAGLWKRFITVHVLSAWIYGSIADGMLSPKLWCLLNTDHSIYLILNAIFRLFRIVFYFAISVHNCLVPFIPVTS